MQQRISHKEYIRLQNEQACAMMPAYDGGVSIGEFLESAKDSVDTLLKINNTVILLDETVYPDPMTSKEMQEIFDKDGHSGVYRELRKKGLII